MLTVDQAFEKIADYAVAKSGVLGIAPPQTLSLPLAECLGRLLADPVVATLDVPPFDNSAMDGFALHTDSLANAQCEDGTWMLPVQGRVAAGDAISELPEGAAVQIFTGAPIPRGANAVVMQENCAFDTQEMRISIKQSPQAQDNIRSRGQDVAEGNMVLPAGRKLYAQDIGLCAALGYCELPVQASVRVALLNTGDELVAPGQSLAPGQIYNSNGVMLTALLTQMGAKVVVTQHVPDGLAQTQAALVAASAEADLVICTGGVSVGAEDHVKDALDAVGEIAFWKVAMKPGKPLAVGTVGQSLFMGLPGNPVSAFVTAQLFLPLMLQALRGFTVKGPHVFKVPSAFGLSHNNQRAQWLRATLSAKGVEVFPNQSSGVLSSVSWGNALCLIPPRTVIQPGDLLDVYPYSSDPSLHVASLSYT